MHPTEPLEGIVITGDDAGAIVKVTSRSPLDLFTAPGVVPALLDAIRQEATRDFTPDLSTDRGRKEIASRAFKVAKSKTYLDDLGKEEVARLKDLPRQVDAGRKALRDGLDALRDDIRRPLTEWEERRERLQARLNELRNLPARLFQADSAAIRAAIDGLDDQVGAPGSGWDDFQDEAFSAGRLVRSELEDLLAKAEKREAEAAELERLRAEKAERERLDHEEKLRKEGEERARAAAQVPAAGQGMAEGQNPPTAAPPTVAAPLPAPQADALRRGQDPASDLEHRRAFNREALADMADHIRGAIIMDQDEAEEAAKAVLTAIVTGKIRHVSITY